MDRADKTGAPLPRIWGGERVSPNGLMGLYTQAARGEISVHVVGLEGLKKMFTVFTEKGEEGDSPYNPPSRAEALKAVANRRDVEITTLRYIGALVGEEITYAKEAARKRLLEHESDIRAARR
jgi:hypothetical protein